VARAEEEAEIASLPISPWTNDDELVALWLHGKSPHTIRAYGEDVAAFRAFTGKGLRATYLWDLQRYAEAPRWSARDALPAPAGAQAAPLVRRQDGLRPEGVVVRCAETIATFTGRPSARLNYTRIVGERSTLNRAENLS
jgi:hypothetical protein